MSTPVPATSAVPAPADSKTLEPIKIQKADYPIEAEDKGLQGRVVVNLTVSETGDVENVEVVSGDPVLARSAVDAAKKWKFKPFIKNGKPIQVKTKIPFDFAFSDKITDKKPPSAGNASDAQSPERIQISQGIAQGMLIHKVQPAYPLWARANHVQGTVLLQAVIGKDGQIADLKPLSGPQELIPAAVGAVQQWRYRPYLLAGQPIEVMTKITVIFALQR